MSKREQWIRLIAAGLLLGAVAALAFTVPVREAAQDARESSGSLAGDFLVARMAASERDEAVATARLAAAVEKDPTNVDLLERAFLLSLTAGEIEQALRFGKMLAGRKSDAPLAQMVLGIEAMRDRRYADARIAFERSATPPGSAFTAGLLKAWALAGERRFASAMDTLNTLPGVKDAESAFVTYHRALLLEMSGDAQSADAAYRKVLSGNPEANIRMVEAYGAFLARQGRASEALQLYDAIKPNEQGVKNPFIAAARDTVAAGKVPEPPVPDVAAGTAETLYGIAAAVVNDRNYDLPALYLHLALFARSDFDIAAGLLGEIYQTNQDYPAALEAYARVPRDSPFYIQSQIEIARLLDDQKKPGEAIALLERLLAEPKAKYRALVALGDVHRGQKNWSEAADAYSQAIALDEPVARTDWVVHYAYGIVLERAKRWAEAEPQFLKALEISPGQPYVMNYLGYTWIEMGVNVDQAKQMIEQAVAARPNDGFIVDSLGWAHYKLGDYRTAVQYLEQAVLLEPGDSTINDHLGDAYWRVGREREARFQWSHALAFEPDPELVPSIKAKLERGLDATAAVEPPPVPAPQ